MKDRNQNKLIIDLISQMPDGAVFTFSSLSQINIAPSALAVILSRLTKKGIVQRLARGRYGKIRQTRFGSIFPSDDRVLESILRPQNSNFLGYISEVAAYNRLGLTTQIPSEVVIAGATSLRRSKVGKLKIRYVTARAPVTEENRDLLPLLDALRDIKKIPDTSIEQALEKIRSNMSMLESAQKEQLFFSSHYYPPRVRALLGVLFESIGEKELAAKEKKTLNPISTYKMGLGKVQFLNCESWNLK